jgi:hypothetical protein
MTRPPDDSERKRDREALVALLAADAEETARSGANDEPPPEPEKLLDFLAGRLDPKEEERLSGYLMANPDASRALLDLEDFEAAGAQAGKRPADLAAVAGWRDLEHRLPAAPSRFRRFQRLLPSIAAALLVTTIGLGVRVWQLQGERGRPVASLQSIELAETRAGTKRTVSLAPGAPLRLVIHPAPRCPDYEAVVEGPKPGDRLVIPKLTRDDKGLLTPLLYPKPGSYNLRLYGCEPRQEVGTYSFNVKFDGD